MAELSVHDWTVHVLGGTVLVEQFSEDNDAITFPQDRELTTYRVGAQGNVAFFGSPNRKTGLFVVKLLPTSPTAKTLKIQEQRMNNGNVINWDAVARNRRTNLQINMRRGRLTKAPVAPNIGPEPANLMFEFFYEDITEEWVAVTEAV